MNASTDVTYYVSAYASSPGMMSVIAPRHDQNLALWRVDGSRVDLVRVWELERISGQKHHFWPMFGVERCEQVLRELLAPEGLTLDDIAATWGTPGFPRHTDIVMPRDAGEYPVHSLAHLFSGLLLDTATFRDETIVALAVDGRPDFGLDHAGKKYWYAGCVAKQGDVALTPVESPAPIYDAATASFGKEPGTLMALAEACATRIDFDARAAVRELQLFGGRQVPLVSTLPLLESMIAAARQQWSTTSLDDRFTDDENLQAAVMKLVQKACEIVMVRNVDRMLDEHAVDPRRAYLSVTGGFALNCPTNSMLLRRYDFRGLLTPPSANDSGQSLGLGLLGLHGLGHLPGRDFQFDSPYRGSELSDVAAAVEEHAEHIESVTPFCADRFVEDIVGGPLVWVDGASEVGPRALGHRSLLADPRTARSKDLLNAWKSRQWWRPVAPVVLEEHAGEWFEDADASPYMLRTTRVRAERRGQVPAVLHLDDSARHQTLSRRTNPLLHDAIEAFRAATGVPMLCNTSLNEKGEPIVETASEALRFALRNGATIAYLGGQRVALRADIVAEGAGGVRRHPRRAELFADQEAVRDEIWDAWLGAGYTPAAMVLMARSPELRDSDSVPPEVVTELAEVAIARDDSGTLEQAAQKHARMFGPSASFDPGSKEGAVF